jgi:hypothetical protein
VDAAVAAAKWLDIGHNVSMMPYEFREESFCGKCGRTLTDPESIDRGIGPECMRQQTSSHHQVKNTQLRLQTAPITAGNEKDVDDESAEDHEVMRVLNECSMLTDDQIDKVWRNLGLWISQRR